MTRFKATIAESRKRWKPDSPIDRVCQIIGATHGFSTAKACRQYQEAAVELFALMCLDGGMDFTEVDDASKSPDYQSSPRC